MLSRDLESVGGRVRALREKLGGEWLDRPDYDLEKRFIDAQVHWDMGHFDKASVLLFDLVESEVFRQSASYDQALLLLGKSLRMDGNYAAARTAFEQVVDRRAPALREALAELVEISLDTADARHLQIVVERMEGVRERDGTLQFSLGKGLFHLGRAEAARAVLQSVPAADPSYGAARYYLGVIATGEQRFREAIERFREARAAAEVAEQAGVRVFGGSLRDQSLLALGRLLSDQGDLSGAVEAYEAVERTSVVFESALLELGWAYLTAERPAEARDTLEILLLVANGRQIRTEAAILRGRVLDRLGEVDAAVDAFQSARNELTPVRAELESIASSDRRLEQYFEWLTKRRSSSYPMPSPLSEGAEAFIEAKQGLGQVVVLLDDVGEKRRDLQEMDDVIAQLDAALQTARPIDVFPKLQSAWVQAMAAENSLILIARALLDLEHALHMIEGGGSPPAAAALQSQRHQLESSFLRAVPQTVAEYQSRAQLVEDQLQGLRRETFLARQQWKDAANKLRAMEVWTAQTREERNVEPAAEQRLHGELIVERMLLDQLQLEIEGIERGIELEAARSGVAEVEPVDTANIKNRIFEIQLDNHEALGRVRKDLPHGARRTAESLAQLRNTVWQQVTAVGEMVKYVEKRVKARTAELSKVVATEKGRIESYRGEIDAVADSSRFLASSLGYELFRGATERVDELAMEADVGILDAAWSQKEAKADEIRRVQQIEGQRLDEIRRALSELDVEAAEDAVSDAIPGAASGGTGAPAPAISSPAISPPIESDQRGSGDEAH